jgi:hypothetical protein
MYEDDGRSLNYRKGQQALTRITAELTDSVFTLNIPKPNGRFKAPKHNYMAKIHLPPGQNPVAISENGRKVTQYKTLATITKGAGWYYNPAVRILWVKTNRSNNANIQLAVKLDKIKTD